MCDTVVRILPGRILFAKNSDRDANEGQSLDFIPAEEQPKGKRLRCTWIEIPEAPRTHALLLSRPYWMWGAEMGTNEHGVVIGNEAVFTKEPVPEVGLTGMDLVRLGLSRGSTKEEAVSEMIRLLETHGQGGRCGHENANFRYFSSFLVADQGGAIVLETSGRSWTTENVSSGSRGISNGLTIPGFADKHSDTIKTYVSACRIRRARIETLGERASDIADMMALLRDHGEGHSEPVYKPHHGAMSAPCMHGGGLLASSQTTASWVSELTENGASHWVTATAAPCLSIFKPVSLDAPLNLGPFPTGRADSASLFWRHERFHRRMMQNPAKLARYIEERDELEERFLRESTEPREAFRQAEELLERWMGEVGGGSERDGRPWYVRRYWERRNRWAGMG